MGSIWRTNVHVLGSNENDCQQQINCSCLKNSFFNCVKKPLIDFDSYEKNEWKKDKSSWKTSLLSTMMENEKFKIFNLGWNVEWVVVTQTPWPMHTFDVK